MPADAGPAAGPLSSLVMTEPAAKEHLRLSAPVTELPGVGQRRAQLLNRLEIHTLNDLLRHLPMRYERESAEDAIAHLPAETNTSARGTITAARWVPGRAGKKGRFEAALEDDTGRLHLVWFNAGYLRDRMRAGMVVRVQGKTRRFNDYLQMVNPRWEVLSEPEQTPRRDEQLRPVYPATEELPSRIVERLIGEALPRVTPGLRDPLPAALLEHHAMPDLASAYQMVHQPNDEEQAASARRRLAFNELLLLQLGIQMKRAYVQEKLEAPALRYNDAIDEHIRARFPFELTRAQQRVMRQIADDLARAIPMNRMLQGDVGAGKTVVALFAMLVAVANRKQAALMAPTELLAEQHFGSISRMLEGANVRLALLTGSTPAPGSGERRELLEQIGRGEIDLVIGTHALLGQAGTFHDLALLVIDEQHRFGVQQRAAFRASSSEEQAGTPAQRQRVPHHLIMTATPIPRTLSLTIFGDLDVSTLDELPPGRTPITNRVVGPDMTDRVYGYLRQRLERGEQAYVVVPAIDPSGDESSAQLRNVRDLARRLQDRFADRFRVAAVHGRLKRSTRERLMDRFRRGEVHVLVATTVIEVGVDVPNATVMIIEHAERFGLAQLHQLRGRIGRGTDGRASLCVFIGEPSNETAQHRLDAIGSTNDGFKVAELDLQIRGMGEFFGTRQAGLPPLRVASIPDDMDLLNLARRDAADLIEADSWLQREEHALLRRVLLRQYGEALGLIDVG